MIPSTNQQHLFCLSELRDDALRSQIQVLLREHNLDFDVRAPNAQPLCISVTSAEGDWVGGLVSFTYWEWLSIDLLGVKQGVRRQGIGTQLIHQAEHEARRRGCRYARTSTYVFQALALYQRLGYEIVGQLENYPSGATLYWLRKTL